MILHTTPVLITSLIPCIVQAPTKPTTWEWWPTLRSISSSVKRAFRSASSAVSNNKVERWFIINEGNRNTFSLASNGLRNSRYLQLFAHLAAKVRNVSRFLSLSDNDSSALSKKNFYANTKGATKFGFSGFTGTNKICIFQNLLKIRKSALQNKSKECKQKS